MQKDGQRDIGPGLEAPLVEDFLGVAVLEDFIGELGAQDARKAIFTKVIRALDRLKSSSGAGLGVNQLVKVRGIVAVGGGNGHLLDRETAAGGSLCAGSGRIGGKLMGPLNPYGIHVAGPLALKAPRIFLLKEKS